MKCKEIIKKIEEKYPVSFAEEWDNPGLLVGDPEKEVKKVFLALDVTDESLEEAVKTDADMIITHHPLIFSGIKKVTEDNFIGRRIIGLIKNDISYYAMHTNFDVLGMADLGADYLELTSGRCWKLLTTGKDKEKVLAELEISPNLRHWRTSADL